MKGNEENRGLNDKKALENQFTTFGHCNLFIYFFGSFFHSLILSYSRTLREFFEDVWRTLVFNWIWRKKEKERRKVQGDSWIKNYN